MIWLLACTQVDPELTRKGTSVRLWREGMDQLASAPAEAHRSFAAANQARPDPLLAAWTADALAADGDLETAIVQLQAVLDADPRFAEARYNRAAYLARMGRLEEAGEELSIALDYGVRRPRQAMTDPDFAKHLDDPAFAFLPDHLLVVTLDVPDETLFWGNEARVRLRVLGADAAPITVEGPMEGPLELIAVSEGVIDTTEGPSREVSWTYRVRAAGEATIGPLVVRSAGHEHTISARTFSTAAPPGKHHQGQPEHTLVTGSHLPNQTGARWVDGELWVRSAPGDRIEIAPKPTDPPLQMRLFDRGTIVAVVQRHRLPARARVRIRRAGTTVYED